MKHDEIVGREENLTKNNNNCSGLRIEKASDVKIRPIKWLWPFTYLQPNETRSISKTDLSWT